MVVETSPPVSPALPPAVFCSFLPLAMQKHLDDLLRQVGFAPEWKDLLRDLDRLAEVRIRHRGADRLVRTDAPAVAAILRVAHVAPPPRARTARPPPSLGTLKNAAAARRLNLAGTSIQSDVYENKVFKS
jgi:hypothetical protein